MTEETKPAKRRGPGHRDQPIWMSPMRERRMRALQAGRILTPGDILDMGIEAYRNRMGDEAEELCLRVARYLIDQMAELAGEGRKKGRYLSVYLSPARLQHCRAIREESGLSMPDVFDLGLDAGEAKFGVPEQELLLAVARDARVRLAEAGKYPYPDPDAEHERDLEYVLSPHPLRGTVPPLRAGRMPRGVRMRPPQAS